MDLALQWDSSLEFGRNIPDSQPEAFKNPYGVLENDGYHGNAGCAYGWGAVQTGCSVQTGHDGTAHWMTKAWKCTDEEKRRLEAGEWRSRQRSFDLFQQIC